MELLNTSIFRKDDFSFDSLNGTTYTIKGNLSTEFYLWMLEAWNKINIINEEENKAVQAFNALNDEDKTAEEKYKINAIKMGNLNTIVEMLKQFAFKLASLDKSKEITEEIIDNEFDDYSFLMALFGKVITMITTKAKSKN